MHELTQLEVELELPPKPIVLGSGSRKRSIHFIEVLAVLTLCVHSFRVFKHLMYINTE
jgi:hypothetical protein